MVGTVLFGCHWAAPNPDEVWRAKQVKEMGQLNCTELVLPMATARCGWPVGLKLWRAFLPALGPQGRMTAYCTREKKILSLRTKRAAACGAWFTPVNFMSGI